MAASPPLPASSSPHIPAVHLEDKAEESRTTSRYLQSDWCKLHPEAEQAYRYIENGAQLPEHCSATAVTPVLLLNHSPACGVQGKGSRGTSPCHTTSEEISPIPQKQEEDLASEVAKKSLSHLRSSVRIVQYTNIGFATVLVLAHY